MFEPTFTDRVKKRLEKQLKPLLVPLRARSLKSKDFTIISNNCWGGVVYEWYGLKKMSPTAGMWMFSDDYLKFISNLKYYLSLDIEMKTAKDSKRYERLADYRSENAPIGVLDDDIEIVFLHYKDAAIAKEKWERRCKRVNYNNLILKFSYMNDCTPEMLRQFDNMEFSGLIPKKIMFVNKVDPSLKCGVYMPGFDEDQQITNDTYFFNKYFDLAKFINEGIIVQRHNGL